MGGKTKEELGEPICPWDFENKWLVLMGPKEMCLLTLSVPFFFFCSIVLSEGTEDCGEELCQARLWPQAPATLRGHGPLPGCRREQDGPRGRCGLQPGGGSPRGSPYSLPSAQQPGARHPQERRTRVRPALAAPLWLAGCRWFFLNNTFIRVRFWGSDIKVQEGWFLLFPLIPASPAATSLARVPFPLTCFSGPVCFSLIKEIVKLWSDIHNITCPFSNFTVWWPCRGLSRPTLTPH